MEITEHIKTHTEKQGQFSWGYYKLIYKKMPFSNALPQPANENKMKGPRSASKNNFSDRQKGVW